MENDRLQKNREARARERGFAHSSKLTHRLRKTLSGVTAPPHSGQTRPTSNSCCPYEPQAASRSGSDDGRRPAAQPPGPGRLPAARHTRKPPTNGAVVRGSARNVNATDTPHFLLVRPYHLHSRKSENDRRAGEQDGTAAEEWTREPRRPGSNPASSTCQLWRHTLSYRAFLCLRFLSCEGETTVTPTSRSCCGTRE